MAFKIKKFENFEDFEDKKIENETVFKEPK